MKKFAHHVWKSFASSLTTPTQERRRFIQAAQTSYKNPTLEHYTNYKAAELKPTVLRLQELQLNNNESSLNAIRDKYRQPKFKCVATLSSPKLVQSLFESLTRADPCNVIN
ncbi:hypothetical protein LguiA_036430 [Lonicera macranthoides]